MAEDRRARLLALARSAAELPEPARRYAVAGVIRERYAQEAEAALRGDRPEIPCGAEEVVDAAYPAPGRYWRAWLERRLPREELIARLAEATAASATDALRRGNLLHTILAACPPEIAAGEAVETARWLLTDPDAEELLPPSLLGWLSPAEPAARSEAPSTTGEAAPEPSDPAPGTAGRAPPPEKLAEQHPGSFRALWREVKALGLKGAAGYQRKELLALWRRLHRDS